MHGRKETPAVLNIPACMAGLTLILVISHDTVIDVITAPEKFNSTSEWCIFRAQKIAKLAPKLW